MNLSNKGFGGSLIFFFFNLESRLDSIIIRSNFATKFFIRNFIRNGFVFVNNLKTTYLNYIIKVNDVVSFDEKKHRLIYSILKGAVKFKRFFAQPPFYLEINYRTLCISLIPKLIDPKFVPYPFQLEENHLFWVCIQFCGVGKIYIRILMTHLKVKLRIAGSKRYKFKQF